MIYFNAFIVCGLICVLGQLIYDLTSFTAGHITSMFVVIGALMDFFDLYDKLIAFAGAGAGAGAGTGAGAGAGAAGAAGAF